jgi:DNA-binding CsgD family transcriptional regulator
MEEAVSIARDLNWVTLVGHAFDTEGMPPYLPFIEALQDYANSSQQEELETRLADAQPELALLVPALGRSGRQLQGARPDPETQRYRLYEAVSDLLLKIAGSETSAGLLLCLDDLHWADESTLFLLEHFIRKPTSAPVLVLATYRDTELDVSKPLARTLEQLMRRGVASRLDLKRMDRKALAALLAVLGGPDPPPSLVDTVFNETEGNPFFVREVFQYLQETGRLVDALGAWRTDLQVTELDVPESVRLVIAGRLARVSDRCRQCLTAAAVAGRGVSLVLLQKLADLGEEALLEAVEEAERAHLVAITLDGAEERLTFAHELIRQTLLAELSLPRRRRLHVRIARALEERHSADLDEHAAELAAHFGHSSDPGELEKAIAYSENAADHATALYAWTEAARLLERALGLLTLASPEGKIRRCDLLLRLCDALLAADQPRRVFSEVAEEAYAIAEALGDDARGAAACHIALLSAFSLGPASFRYLAPWAERADRLIPQDTVARVHKDAAVAWIRLDRPLAGRAVEMARDLGDMDAFYVAAYVFLWGLTPTTEQACLELATEIALSPRNGIRPRLLFRTLEAAAEVLLAWGERDLAERIGRELAAHAEATGDSTATTSAAHFCLSLAAIDGRLEEAVAEASSLASFETGMLAWRNGFRPLLLLGTPQHLQRAAALVSEIEGLSAILGYLLRAHTGVPEPGEPQTPGWQPREHMVTFLPLLVLEIVVLRGGNGELVRKILDFLKPAASPATACAFTLIDRHRGAAHVLLGEHAQARERFSAALAAGEKMRFRPEIALTRLALAELILDHFPRERTEAFEHLEACIPEFREMKMQPSLRKAEELLTRRARWRPRPPVYPDGLSAREVEILRLIARGRTNQQIAQELTISLNTVLHHVTNILGKTGAANRTEAAGYAHRRNLTS